MLLPHVATPQGHVVAGPAPNQQEGTFTLIPKWLIGFIVPAPSPHPSVLFLTSPGLCWPVKTEDSQGWVERQVSL